eukprot:scaffold81752_cov63-Phaeocystis_antarctica.AAC.2
MRRRAAEVCSRRAPVAVHAYAVVARVGVALEQRRVAMPRHGGRATRCVQRQVAHECARSKLEQMLPRGEGLVVVEHGDGVERRAVVVKLALVAPHLARRYICIGSHALLSR